MNVELVDTVEQAFRMLHAGRNDVVVDLRTTQCKLKHFDVSGIRALEPPLARIPLYHYLHARHKALSAKLETVLTRMEQEGDLKTIQEQARQDFQELCGQ
jgi:polar amino acid transport system substrate-binding protein